MYIENNKYMQTCVHTYIFEKKNSYEKNVKNLEIVKKLTENATL